MAVNSCPAHVRLQRRAITLLSRVALQKMQILGQSKERDAFGMKRTGKQPDYNPRRYRIKRILGGRFRVRNLLTLLGMSLGRSKRLILLKISNHSIHTIYTPQRCTAVRQFLGALVLRKYAPVLLAMRHTRTTRISPIIPHFHACYSSVSYRDPVVLQLIGYRNFI